MKRISDSHFDIRDYFGDLVILYPEGYADPVASLRERPDISGHVYHCLAAGKSLLEKAGMNPSASSSMLGGRIYLSLPERRMQGLFRLNHEFSNNFLCPRAAGKQNG